MKTLINWKVYFILLAAAIFSTIAVLPYSLELQSEALTQTDIPTLLASQIIQRGITYAILIFLGMILMKRIGLSAPILDSVAKGESASGTLRGVLPISIVLGVVATLLIIGLDFIFQPLLLKELGDKADALKQVAQPAA
jgi:hypothetical protein